MTNSPPPPQMAVSVEQADRQAAAAWCLSQPFPSKQVEGPMIAAGEYDHHSLVQAFARHRLSAAPPADGVLREVSDLRERMANALIVASGRRVHASDCATSCAPAEDPGPCDCATTAPSSDPGVVELRENAQRLLNASKDQRNHMALRMYALDIEKVCLAALQTPAPSLSDGELREALELQMEDQDAGLPSSVARDRGLVWLEGWFDLRAALTTDRGEPTP